MKIALTIAGSDSGGGAGIQADLKTFQQFGVFGTSVIVALTAQNTRGVRAVETVSEAMVAAQLAALAEDLPPAALKTGMLAEASLVRLVGKAIREHGWSPLVVDPVMVSTSGHRLLTPEAEDVVRESLLPLAALVTPNLDEAAILTGRAVHDEASMARAGETLLSFGAGAALVKGGHLAGDEITDLLVTPAGSQRVSPAADRDHLHPRHRLHALRRHHRRPRARPRPGAGGGGCARLRPPRHRGGAGTRRGPRAAESHRAGPGPDVTLSAAKGPTSSLKTVPPPPPRPAAPDPPPPAPPPPSPLRATAARR